MTTDIAQRQASAPMIIDGQAMQQVHNFAQTMATGVATVPKHLQGNAADCMAVCMQAMQWGMNPYSVAQKTHLINGTLGYEAQLVSAVVSSSTAIEGRFHYEYGGEWKDDKDPTAWVRVGAILRGEAEIQWGNPLYPANQTVKNSPLWKTDPKQQSSYLALKRWARLYTPAVILGVYTSDELQDMPKEKDITPIKPESAIRGPSKTNEAAAQTESVVETQEPEREIPDQQKEVVDALLKVMAECKTVDELDSVLEPINSKLTGRNKKLCLSAYEKRKKQISS